MTRTYWAAYAGTANGSDISLHLTEIDALLAVLAALGVDPDDIDAVEGDEARGVGDMDADELREFLTDYCSGRADDYEVREVELPDEPDAA